MKKVLIFGLAFLLLGCNTQEEQKDNNQITEKKEAAETAIFYTIVENLRIRTAPNLTSDVLSTLEKNTKLISLNEQSTHQDSIKMDGKWMVNG